MLSLGNLNILGYQGSKNGASLIKLQIQWGVSNEREFKKKTEYGVQFWKFQHILSQDQKMGLKIWKIVKIQPCVRLKNNFNTNLIVWSFKHLLYDYSTIATLLNKKIVG